MTINRALLGAVASAGCVMADDAPGADPAVGVDESALCVVSFGGHEVCDGVDNDCDGSKDESCSPIDIAGLPIAGCHYWAQAAVTTSGSVIASRANYPDEYLDVIAPSGGTQLGTTTVAPRSIGDLERAPSGRIYALTHQTVSPPMDFRVHAVTSDGVVGPPLAQGVFPAWHWGLGIDAAGNLFTDGYDWVIRRWNGSAFVPWSSAVVLSQTLLAAAPDGQSVYTEVNGWWYEGSYTSAKLYRVTPTASTVIDDHLIFADARLLAATALHFDSLGRIYLTTVCSGAVDLPCMAVFRYAPNGKQRILVAQSAEAGGRAIGIDPSTDELVLYSDVESCGDPLEAAIVRLSL